MEKFRICSAAHLSLTVTGQRRASVTHRLISDSKFHSLLRSRWLWRLHIVVRLWGAERWWKGQLDFLITFVWYSSCLLVWLLVIGRIWERFIENETFVVNYCSTFWGGSGGCAHFEVGHASRSLRSTDVNAVGGKLGLFCLSLVCRIHFPHPGCSEINNIMYILVLQQPRRTWKQSNFETLTFLRG